ncbi:hypothetical protein BH09BAC2_BH09BAC2_06580 [soil metagenome]
MHELIVSVNADLSTKFNQALSQNELQEKIAAFINDLITRDFQKLLFILYRLDISEQKLKNMLETADQDAGSIISGLIVERELQKIETRKQYRSNIDLPDEEKW